jgi:hypothetical protein
MAASRSQSGPDSSGVHGGSIGPGSRALRSGVTSAVAGIRRRRIEDWSVARLSVDGQQVVVHLQHNLATRLDSVAGAVADQRFRVPKSPGADVVRLAVVVKSAAAEALPAVALGLGVHALRFVHLGRATGISSSMLYRPKSHRCMSSRVAVFVDESIEDAST